MEWLSHVPVWWIIRAGGLLAYFLLFTGVALGITYSMPNWKPRTKARIYKLHSSSIHAGLIITLVHVVMLLLDTYVTFSIWQLLVPFSAPKHPVWYGLGTIALYGILVIMLTTDFKFLLSKKTWKFIHLFAYPVFLGAMVHGLMSGTDTTVPWVFVIYLLTCVTIGVLSYVRMIMALNKRQRAGGLRNNENLAGGRR